MTIREWLNRNSAIATIVVILVLVAALWIIIKSQGGRGISPPPPVWFYCLETGELFGAPPGSNAPIPSPFADGEAVEAKVYFDGGCDGDPQIAFLSMFQQHIKRKLDEQLRGSAQGQGAPPVDTIAVAMGTLVSLPDPIEWVGHESARGYELRTKTSLDEGGQSLPFGVCHPELLKTDEP